MLRLSVGYQDSEKFLFSDIVKTYAPAIEEVYFAWVGEKSGRSAIGGYDGYFDYTLQERLVSELKKSAISVFGWIFFSMPIAMERMR
jgi:hypothetical protein